MPDDAPDRTPPPEGPSPPARRRWLRNLAINLAVATVSLMLALLVCEAVVRLVAPQQLILIRPDVWQPVDTLGWRKRPNLDTKINTGDGEVTLRTDSLGLRVGRAGRRDADTRVLLLGDSFMEALQVNYEESLAGQLEERVGALLGRPVSVWNTGVGGWSPSHYLLEERRLIGKARFDVVLVSVYLGNDVMTDRVARYAPREPAARPDFRLPRHLTSREIIAALLAPINDRLEKHSQLFVLMKKRLQTTLMRVGLTAAYFPTEFRRSTATAPQWRVAAEICRAIADTADANGAAAVFMLIPAPFQVDTAIFTTFVRGFGLDTSTVDLHQPTRVLAARMAEEGLRVIDPLPALRQARESGARLYGVVDDHFNARGHEVVTAVVAPIVADIIARRTSARATRR